jgi:Ca2+-binding EF-hand superfamily protein
MRQIPVFFAAIFFAMLTLPAMAQRAMQDPSQIFDQADTNHDGRVSRDEFLAARSARFDKLDRNHDGDLTDADIPAFLQSNASMMQKMHAMLASADTNHDGKVSREEFVQQGMQLFDMADTNHDGYVDKDEMQQAAQKIKTVMGR